MNTRLDMNARDRSWPLGFGANKRREVASDIRKQPLFYLPFYGRISTRACIRSFLSRRGEDYRFCSFSVFFYIYLFRWVLLSVGEDISWNHFACSEFRAF